MNELQTDQPEVLFETRGRAGVVTLNRPQALNALTHPMVRAIRRQLDAWAEDPAIGCIVLRAAGKAFCAGGDIRQVYELGRAGDPRQLEFFADEYRLNARLRHYPKPLVSLIDGVVMGGGVGLSVHGRYRVGGERITFAMPEVGIGFFPDVGGSHFLPRLRGLAFGLFCALAAARLKRADAHWAGVLTHCADAGRFDEIVDALAAAEDVEIVLAGFHADPGPAPLAAHADTIDACFAGADLAAILAALEADGGPDAAWRAATAAAIRGHSPTSLAVALRQLRAGAGLDFDACMRMEYRIVSRILAGHDFYEGVRAVIVDKDGSPRWDPARLDAVEPFAIDAHFMAPQGGDLVLR